MEKNEKLQALYLEVRRYAALAESVALAAEKVEAADDRDSLMYKLDILMELAYLMRDGMKNMKEHMFF